MAVTLHGYTIVQQFGIFVRNVDVPMETDECQYK